MFLLVQVLAGALEYLAVLGADIENDESTNDRERDDYDRNDPGGAHARHRWALSKRSRARGSL